MNEPIAPASPLDQLYRQYSEPLVRYLERLVGDRETAEDLSHETFIKALRHWEQARPTQARGWLYRIATNTAYDYLRRRRRIEIGRLTDDHEQFFVAPPIEARYDDAEPILAALHRIPEHYRLPLLLATAGYEHKDIATALNSNVNTIKTRVHRARIQFRQFYAA